MTQKNNNSSNTLIGVVVFLMLFGVAYYIQKWTGIPVLDWLDALSEWLWNAIGWLLGKLLELIAKILPN